jgi:hypothetical protein
MKRRKDRSENDNVNSSVNLSQLSLNISSNADSLVNSEKDQFMNPFSKTIHLETELKENICLQPKVSEVRLSDADYIKAQTSSQVQNSDSFSFQKPQAKPKVNFLEKSLKTAVTIESDKSLKYWNDKLLDPSHLLHSMKNPSNDGVLVYYRYPDSTLPSHQKKAVHRALLQFSKKKVSDDNLTWYRMFSEKWRKSLISAFYMLKYNLVGNFYFVQDNLTVFFEKNMSDLTIRAYLQLSSLALAEDLKNNGTTRFIIYISEFYFVV